MAIMDKEEQPEGVNLATSEDAIYVYKNYSASKDEQRQLYRAQQKMPNWPIKEDFVISGMSGRFPESDSVREFEYNLYENIDMICEDERRWPFGYLGLPKGSGKLKDISRFDHRFFNVNEKDANFMDSQVRLMLETTFEALWDAGIDPATLAGSNTGVFLGNCFDEYLAAYAEDYTRIPEYIQCFYGTLANVFDLRGPSKHFDTACASGFSALHEAMVSLRSGQCDRAIVAGLNICLRAATQNQFLNLNMISPDGHCKCLDDDANGYAKGEAVVILILQRRSEAKRIYATVVHTKTNCDGYKDMGITYPSFELQRELVEDTYAEANINPNEVGFCEAHCTGTQAGDPSEMRAITEAMCKDRKEPLLIGAIKSVIGHTEASSGLCSLVKTLLCFEHELIPANMHMSKINHRIDGLVSGVLQPVITNTPYHGKYIALNCFGFGGVNVHAIIRKHELEQENNTLPMIECKEQQVPRLVTFCGRNQETLKHIFDEMKTNPDKTTLAYLSLLNDVSKTTAYPHRGFKGMRHRGYAMLESNAETNRLIPIGDMKANKIKDKVKPPVCYIFTGMGSQWASMGEQLTRIESIRNSLEACDAALKTIDPEFDLMNILTDSVGDKLKSPLNSFVAIAAIQIGLVDLLNQMNISPDYIIGHSIGELLCAYADGCLSREETIIGAYWRGNCIESNQLAEDGAMAAVACSWEEATEWCKELADGQVWPACHNGDDSVTVSGLKSHVDTFLEKLRQKNEDLFARPVNSSGVAFHSPLIEPIRYSLLNHITVLLSNGPERKKTSRWISSTYEEDRQFDAGYLVDNLIEPVRFHQSLQRVPSNAIFIEIGPHHLLQAIVKRTLMSTKMDVPIKYVASLSRQNDNISSIMTMLGQLYLNGLNPRIEELYPKYQYPVPRKTAQLHSLIQWKHDRQFTVTQYPDFYNQTKLYESTKVIDLQHPEDKHIEDHCIDGRILFPATGYLYLAWKHMAQLLDVDMKQLPIVFENVSLHRATIMPRTGVTNFDVFFLNGNGKFTITEGGMLTTSGTMRIPSLNNCDFLQHQSLLNRIQELEGQTCLMEMKNKDVYKEFRLRGYDYGPEFQAVTYIRHVGKSISAKVAFKNWITFVDGLIQLAVLGQQTRGLYLPVRFNSLRCDPRILYASIKEGEDLDAFFDQELNIGVAPGIEYQGIKANLAPRKINQQPVEETFEFVPRNELNLPYIGSRAFSEKRNEKLTSQLNSYQDKCLQLLNNAKMDPEELKQYGTTFENEVSNPVLLKLIQSISDWSTVDDQMLESLESDLLFRTYQTERFLRSQLETFCENTWEANLQVVEINQTPLILADKIHMWLLLSSFKVTYTYRLVHSGINKFKSMNLDATHSQHDWLAEKSKMPTDIVNANLIVYKDSSTCPLLGRSKVHFPSLIESMWNALNDRGFAMIILRDRILPVEKKIAQLLNRELLEDVSRVEELESALNKSTFGIISHKSDQFGVHVYTIRKITQPIVVEEQCFMPVTNNVNQWFDQLQTKLRELAQNVEKQENVWLLGNEATSGLIGFISCLHKEPLGNRVRCILNWDKNETLNEKSPIVSELVKLDLFTNAVGPNGVVGCYKHFTLPEKDNEPIPMEHCYLNVSTRGDLSSLRWFESHHKHWPANRKSNETLCTVYYAPLNFRDIMLATGKLPPDALPDNMGMDDCILGLEFAGRDENGNRVMGMVPAKGLATTLVMENSKFLWPIPPQWSMEDASTVPVAYATAYYALFIRGHLQPGEKVLIHSGSGAVGQAAISICLDLNCQLFITVGTETKQNILMELFPQLKANQFFSSRNTDFSLKILQATNGTGVDVILNSLAEEKLQASVNCLAKFGRFLEIGKFDLSQNNKLDLSSMASKTFHGILLDNLLNFGPNVPKVIDRHRDQIWEMMKAGIAKGVVRPLQRTIFNFNQCEDAFRFMASGKHIGKVVIAIREEEKPDPKGMIHIETGLQIPAIPRTVFHSNKSYIVTGGLGGFGLELVNWMIEREARNFVITSRSGVKDLYQKTRLDYFQRLGVNVKVFTGDASNREIAEKLVDEAETLAPLGGVFHLAMVLSDGLFDNQTLESFESVVKPKAETFSHLDEITRKRCSGVDYFVAFSSVSCGVGNPGQSNYGFANSVMERICEERRRDGKHGFAIQWGAIGDVGYIIDNIRGNDVVICGSIPQRMPSCLAALDRLLQEPFAVCSNLIKTDYKFEVTCGKTSLIKTISHILGLKEYENLEQSLTLGELGMDSLMGVEVKQAVERDYDVVLSMQDIRKLTIGKIIEIGSGKTKCESSDGKREQSETNKNAIDEVLMPTDAVRYLNDIVNGDPIIFLPQIDGSYEQIIPIANKLNRPAIGLNWNKDCGQLKTVADVATHYIDVIQRTMPQLESNYDLIGYSFGGVIAIEMGIQLNTRKSGRLGPYRRLVVLDSSPKQFKIFTDEAARKYKIDDKQTDQAFVESILMFLMSKLTIDYGKTKEKLISFDNANKRIEFVRDLFKQVQGVDIQSETLQFLIDSHYNKMLMLNSYECSNQSLPGDVMLLRASQFLVNEKEMIRDDYWLGEVITGQCFVHVLEGNHKTFLTDNYEKINELIRKYVD